MLAYRFLKGGALILKVLDFLLHFSLLLLGLQSLPHAEGNGGFVESLVGLDGHPDLVSDSDYCGVSGCGGEAYPEGDPSQHS